jgi:hypothetical protein
VTAPDEDKAIKPAIKAVSNPHHQMKLIARKS